MKIGLIASVFLSFTIMSCSIRENAQVNNEVARTRIQTQPNGDSRIPVERLRAGISRIKKGWTKEQVIDVLGRPSDPSANNWVYLSEYWATSMYTQYEINFNNNRVVEIKGYGGCDYLSRP